jgi:hypothetical protein
MIYQLIQHNDQSYTLVDESPNLVDDKEKNEWYANHTFGKTLPEGLKWGLVDEAHPWFTKKQDSIPKSLSFQEVLLIEKEKALTDRKATFERNEKFAKYIAAFKG